MQLTSVSFLLFAAVTLVLYYLIPKKVQWVLLLIASYCVSLWAGLSYAAFILLTTLSTYGATMLMAGNLEKQAKYLAENKQTLSREERKAYKASVKNRNRVWLVICLVVNFGVLAVCKAALIDPLRAVLQSRHSPVDW